LIFLDETCLDASAGKRPFAEGLNKKSTPVGESRRLDHQDAGQFGFIDFQQCGCPSARLKPISPQ
jgi:hypothetical protein